MYAQTYADITERLHITGKAKYYHIMNKHAQSYFDALSSLGNLPKTRKIVFDIYFNGLERMIKDFRNFRKSIYQVIDDERFEVLE